MGKPIFDEQTKALWKVGYVHIIDFLFLLAFMAAGIAIGVWAAMGGDLIKIAIAATVVVLATLVWIVVLQFRMCWFVLQVLAAMKTLPADAARLAVQFRAGGEQ